MSYYPLLPVPGCRAVTTLYNFPPNNWEFRGGSKVLVRATWVDEGQWRSKTIGDLGVRQARAFSEEDFPELNNPHSIVLLSMGREPLPEASDELPKLPSKTHTPAWRATISVNTAHTSTSYQGEIDPFPKMGTMLTFAPFLQYGENIENYLLFVNLEVSSVTRHAIVEVYDSKFPKKCSGTFKVRNNAISVFKLDDLGFSTNDLPVLACREMSGIPIYFSRTKDGHHLSMEHTHPPASLVVHGNRWKLQKVVKKIWLDRLGK